MSLLALRHRNDQRTIGLDVIEVEHLMGITRLEAVLVEINIKTSPGVA